VGINLQPTIALLSWNKKRLTLMHTLMGLSHGAEDNDADDDTDVDADDDTTTQMMDDNVDNDAARRQWRRDPDNKLQCRLQAKMQMTTMQP
jgi:hypothetical protein